MLRGTLLALATLAGGCSLVLDFSESAIPKDAGIDAPFSQEECDYKEPNDSAETAAVLVPGDVGPAAICSTGGTDDHDFYRVTVPANTASVTFRITFVNRPTGDLDLRLLDKTGGTVLARSTGFGNFEEITCPGASPVCAALAPDDYVFEVFPALTGSVNRYDIALTITPM
ncbi:MAG: PPC domain-containing protein [Deltaproteobacteria bacterium]|nr:PPC domain-containing protein [Deltaproteobacteria bacterium]MCW5805450.1 PPC domain-containing protein [Deltaproteobacteria bacterium]